MKQCIALAGLACLVAAGCAQTGGLLGKKKCCEPCLVATSRNAPRPNIMRTDCYPCTGGMEGVEQAAYDTCSDVCAECGDACTEDGCGNRCCRGMVNGVAGGFCGCGGAGCGGCGLCPNGGGTYPEYPSFSQGPPVGQVAYPYYTTRGPRDFLARKPASIGPY